MSSKSFSPILIAGLILQFFLSSCSWLRDQPKEQRGFQTSELDLSCLRKMPDQVEKLFSGDYTESADDQKEVQQIWSCLDFSLRSFSKYTQGSNSGFYTDREMMEFANRYLPEQRLFPAKFVTAIFRLKRDVLGGTTDQISKDEIGRLRGKLRKFGEIILPLAPYISTLLKPYNRLNDDRIQIAGKRLKQFVTDISDLLENSENTVEWNDLYAFIRELELYLNSSSPSSLTVIREQIEIFKHLKILAVGGNQNGIEKTKWQPIFKSIYDVYNAIYLSTTSSDMMDSLDLKIEADDQEQAIATENITATLARMKKDPSLFTKNLVELFADRWAKAMIMNSLLYPGNQNRIRIQSFLGSPILRKLTASLLDDLFKAKGGNPEAKLVSRIGENLVRMIEITIGENAPLSIPDIRKYIVKMKPLFSDPKEYEAFDASFEILQSISQVLIGKDSGSLTTTDLRNLIKKGVDLYAAWKEESPQNFNASIAQSLEIILRKPNAKTIEVKKLQSIIQKFKKIQNELDFKPVMDWDKISDWIADGARLKALLFSDSDRSISQEQLRSILDTWNAVGSKTEIDEILEALAGHFKNNPFSSVRISPLINAIDAFLPKKDQLAVNGFDGETLGAMKTLLVGGTSEILDRSEYGKVAQIGYSVYRNLKPALKSLPKDFKFGMDSKSFNLLEKALDSLIQVKGLSIYNQGLKDLTLVQLRKSNIDLKSKTVDKMLIGLNHRILDQNKGKKPSFYPLSFSSQKLEGIRTVLERVKLDFEDFESAFRGVPEKKFKNGEEIYRILNRPDSKKILSSIHPILNSETSMPFFHSIGKPNSRYYLEDLLYKDLIYQLLVYVFPAYEIESDPKKPSSLPRLSLKDLTDLFDDISDAIYELGLSYSEDSAELSAISRMQSINLFTRTGNGNEYIEVIETTDFLATSLAGKPLLDLVRKKLVRLCYPQNSNYVSQNTFSYSCLKNTLFSKGVFKEIYSPVVPQLNAHYQSLNESETSQFQKSIFTAVKPSWNEGTLFNLSDLETLVSIPYYIENIFLRLDHDLNEVLNFSEAMSGFPIFCREIKKSAGSSVSGSCEEGGKPRQVEAIYGHLLMKGEPPRSIKPDDSMMDKIRITKDFLLWSYQWSRLDKDSKVRDSQPPFLKRKDLLSIISNLSTTITPTLPPDQP